MKAAHARRLDSTLASLPAGDPQSAQIRALIARLAGECGCAMGGVFFVTATMAAIAWLLAAGGFSPRTMLSSSVFVMAAAGLGKLTGLGLARVRLALLCRRLRSRLTAAGGKHVNLH